MGCAGCLREKCGKLHDELSALNNPNLEAELAESAYAVCDATREVLGADKVAKLGEAACIMDLPEDMLAEPKGDQ